MKSPETKAAAISKQKTAAEVDDKNSNVLTGAEKAAILISGMDVDVSAEVMRLLGEADLEEVMLAMANLKPVGATVRYTVFQDMYDLSFGGESLQLGSTDFTQQLLSRALGQRKGAEVAERLSAVQQRSAFARVRDSSPSDVAGFLAEEHPQAIAVVLSYLDPKHAGNVMAELPQEVRSEIAWRIATMDKISPQVVRQVEQGLDRKLSSVVARADLAAVGGIQYLIGVLNQVDRGTEKSIIDALEASDPDLAEQVRSQLFTFDDIVKLDDRSIQRVLRDVNKQDLMVALKGTDVEVQETIFRNMSTRASDSLREELEISGPMRLKNVYESQKKIVQIIRALEAAEEIIVQREGEDEYV